MAMVSENLLSLEDLARRYDTQVLREYLLEQEEFRDGTAAARGFGGGGGGGGGGLGGRSSSFGGGDSFAVEDGAEARPPWSEIHEMRLRCCKRLRFILTVNFLVFWSTVAFCGYACHLRVTERGLSALPSLEAGLLAVFVLGSQGTLEVAASAILARPAARGAAPLSSVATAAAAANGEVLGSGILCWDCAAWLTGLGARTAVLLDVLCLPIIYKGSELLFLLSAVTFAFAIGIFVFGVQLRLLLGLFVSSDHFSYDKPDLFFKGRDAHGMCDVTPIAAAPPSMLQDDDQESDAVRRERAPPVNTIKIANCAHFSDLAMLHAVITRLYVPVSCQETQEFIKSASNFSRCFCEDVVQCSVKFFFLMDYQVNPLVLLSLFASAAQAIGACFYSSSPSMDLRITDDIEL